MSEALELEGGFCKHLSTTFSGLRHALPAFKSAWPIIFEGWYQLGSFHTSAIGLRLHGWKVNKCRKHGSGKRAQLTLQTPDG